VQLGGAQHAEHLRRSLPARGAADEQPVLATDRNAPQRPLASVVVDLKLAVV